MHTGTYISYVWGVEGGLLGRECCTEKVWERGEIALSGIYSSFFRMVEMMGSLIDREISTIESPKKERKKALVHNRVGDDRKLFHTNTDTHTHIHCRPYS